MTVRERVLGLIAARGRRRPAVRSAQLDAQFRRLSRAQSAAQAMATEELIWTLWMHHPHAHAAEAIRLAAGDIAAKRHDIAETRLTLLVRRRPDYAEAWHKRATLYYLLGRDEESLDDFIRALELEPRHFAAMLHVAEIFLDAKKTDEARFAFAAALSLHPHLARARKILARD